MDWAFNLDRGAPLREKWGLIPGGTDILITHGPPAHILDRTADGDEVGCEDLRETVDRLRPRLHVFGHIHEGYGFVRTRHTIFANASVCTAAYEARNRPLVFDL
jgi:Icc-related predicted phosphoesterase